MSGKVLSKLKRDLEALAMIQKRTVPEVVAGIKKQITDDGADLDTVAEFFAALDSVAELHIN